MVDVILGINSPTLLGIPVLSGASLKRLGTRGPANPHARLRTHWHGPDRGASWGKAHGREVWSLVAHAAIVPFRGMKGGRAMAIGVIFDGPAVTRAQYEQVRDEVAPGNVARRVRSTARVVMERGAHLFSARRLRSKDAAKIAKSSRVATRSVMVFSTGVLPLRQATQGSHGVTDEIETPSLAAGLGFEPRHRDPESRGLPLPHPAKKQSRGELYVTIFDIGKESCVYAGAATTACVWGRRFAAMIAASVASAAPIRITG